MSEGKIVFWEVVEEHLDEAEFLWAQWERCLVSPSFTLTEVAEREEERLLAQIDGLVAGGEAVRARLLVPALEDADAGRRAAAAFALLGSVDRAAVDPVLACLREGSAEQRASVERALGLSTAVWIDDALRAVLHDAAPAARAAALSALAFRRAAAGAALSGLRIGDDPALLAAAFRVTAGSRERVVPVPLNEALGAPDLGVRDAAIAAGLMLGMPEAWAACQKLVRRGDAESFAAEEPAPLLFAATLGDVREVEPLVNATGSPALRKAAVWALGYSGRVSAAETCLALLGDAQVGRLAGEAFAAITGLPAGGRFVAGETEREAEEPIPIEEEDLDAKLVPRAEDALPMLAPSAVEAWWGEQRSRFERGRRYLGGAPWGRETVLAALAHGPMRRRGGLAMEVGVRTRGRVQMETRALSERQWAETEAAEGIQVGELEKAFG